MSNGELQQQLERAQQDIDLLQEELSETNRGLVALTLELEQRVDQRTVELRAAHAELEKTNSELMQLTLELEDRVARLDERSAQLREANLKLDAANQELEQANQAKDRFLATMSHELRTPLNAILGFTGTLLMKLPGPLTADQEKQLQTIRGSARHLLSLINDILDLAKIESGRVELHKEEVALGEVIRDLLATLRPAAEQKGLALDAELPAEEVTIQADRRALSQIVLNLTNNAIKFTDQGSVRLRLERGGGRVCFRVRDTGIGIAAGDQPKLFHGFVQLDAGGKRRHEGTGLGLYLSQQLARLLGGEITLDSQPGQGSTFTLTLPED